VSARTSLCVLRQKIVLGRGVFVCLLVCWWWLVCVLFVGVLVWACGCCVELLLLCQVVCPIPSLLLGDDSRFFALLGSAPQ
jgi:hypothetical protein